MYIYFRVNVKSIDNNSFIWHISETLDFHFQASLMQTAAAFLRSSGGTSAASGKSTPALGLPAVEVRKLIAGSTVRAATISSAE